MRFGQVHLPSKYTMCSDIVSVKFCEKSLRLEARIMNQCEVEVIKLCKLCSHILEKLHNQNQLFPCQHRNFSPVESTGGNFVSEIIHKTTFILKFEFPLANIGTQSTSLRKSSIYLMVTFDIILCRYNIVATFFFLSSNYYCVSNY